MKYLYFAFFILLTLQSCKKDCSGTTICHTVKWSYSSCSQDPSGKWLFTNVRSDTTFTEVPACETDEFVDRSNTAFRNYYEQADSTWKQFLDENPFKCNCN